MFALLLLIQFFPRNPAWSQPFLYVCVCFKHFFWKISWFEVYLEVRSFGRICIRISDLWHAFRANPFSDQWFIKSTLDKDLLDHWSAQSEDESLDHWSNVFLWAKDLKLIIFPSSAQFQTNRYFLCWLERLLSIVPQILH